LLVDLDAVSFRFAETDTSGREVVPTGIGLIRQGRRGYWWEGELLPANSACGGASDRRQLLHFTVTVAPPKPDSFIDYRSAEPRAPRCVQSLSNHRRNTAMIIEIAVHALLAGEPGKVSHDDCSPSREMDSK
jgi:hypothetical protein